MENHYKVSSQALDHLIRLGYMGGDFDKIEPDQKLRLVLGAELENNPFFQRLDTLYESHRFKLYMTARDNEVHGDMPMCFSFRWDHQNQQVALDILEVVKRYRVLMWEAGPGKQIPAAADLSVAIAVRQVLGDFSRKLIEDQATAALAPLTWAGYVNDAVLCRDRLVNELFKAQERYPGQRGYSVELYTPLPRSQYSLRMQFSCSAYNGSIRLSGLDVYSPGHTLMMTDRDIIPVPHARAVIQVLEAGVQDRTRLAEEKLGMKVYLHTAKKRPSLLIPETAKLIPMGAQLRKSGYFDNENKEAESAYILTAAKKLSADFSYRFVADNQFQFFSRLPLKGEVARQAEVTILHKLDINSMQLSLSGALVTHRKDKEVALLTDTSRPLTQVLQELESHRQVKLITDTLAAAEFITSKNIFAALVQGVILRNHTDPDQAADRPLLYNFGLQPYGRKEDMSFHAQVQITPGTRSCRLICVAGKQQDITLRFFPDRNHQLSHAAVAAGLLAEKCRQADKLFKARDILNVNVNALSRSVEQGNLRKPSR